MTHWEEKFILLCCERKKRSGRWMYIQRGNGKLRYGRPTYPSQNWLMRKYFSYSRTWSWMNAPPRINRLLDIVWFGEMEENPPRGLHGAKRP